jgi:hypothetical protein
MRARSQPSIVQGKPSSHSLASSHVHSPAIHDPVAQATPQSPHDAGSAEVSVSHPGAGSQSANEAAQRHAPATQMAFGPQSTHDGPHAVEVVVVSTQAPPQQKSAPPPQVWPSLAPVHALPGE